MKLLWLQSGGCGGCTLSWLGSEQGPLFRLLADEGIDILWHPSLSEACLDDARELIARCADGREQVDVLCIEGSLLRGPRGSGGFHRFGGGANPWWIGSGRSPGARSMWWPSAVARPGAGLPRLA